MAKKKKKQNKPKQKKKPSMQALRNKLAPDIKVVRNNSGYKLSEAILQFAKPLLAKCSSFEEEEKLLSLAIISWNIGILPDGEADLFKEKMQKCVSPDDMEAAKDMNEIMDYLIARKKHLFAHDQRMVLNYHISVTKDGPHLDVAYPMQSSL